MSDYTQNHCFYIAERLLDYELGYQYTTGTLHLGANFYYTDYTNQFVQTGEVSETGENLTNNIFDRQYAASGWVYSTFGPSCGYTNDNRYYQIGFTPMAGFTAMGRVSVAF